jgi:hypothetical protein
MEQQRKTNAAVIFIQAAAVTEAMVFDEVIKMGTKPKFHALY